MDETTLPLTELLATDLDDGFTELVRTQAGTVRSVLLRLSGSARDADDLGQETFLRAYSALREYPPERRGQLQPRAWLLTIAANVWRNHVRTLSRRPGVADGIEVTAIEIPDGSPGRSSARSTGRAGPGWWPRCPGCRTTTGCPWSCGTSES